MKKTWQLHITCIFNTQEQSHSGGTSVEFYTVTLLSTPMSQRWQYATSVTLMVVTMSTVTAMAATLVCHRCKLTMVQQRWQWQHCNTTVHTSVTAVTTDSTVTALSAATAVIALSVFTAVTALSAVIAVTLIQTSLSQQCQLPLLTQHCWFSQLSQQCQLPSLSH